MTVGAAMMFSTQAQAQISFTVNEVATDGTVLRSEVVTAEAEGEVVVPYHRYNLVDGVLYKKEASGGSKKKEFNSYFTDVTDGSTQEVTGYADANKPNTVFLVEGEDIEGATLSQHDNVLIRASNSSSAFAESDLTVTTLPQGRYRMTVGCFDTSKNGNEAFYNFSIGEYTGDNEIVVQSKGNNLSEATTDFTIYSDDALVWKAGGSETKSIDYIFIQRLGDATSEVKKIDFSVSEMGDGELFRIHIGNAEEGTTVSVPYHYYNVNDAGVLYKKSQTNKEFNFKFEVTESTADQVLEYTATDINNVVYLSEGEDIPGLTVCESSNTGIRSSNSSSAYAKEADVPFVTLVPGTYVIHAVIYDSSKEPDSHWFFKAGDKEIADLNCTVINIQELESEEFTLDETTTISLGQGGSSTQGLDLVYITGNGAATGIHTVNAKAAQDVIFNLAGQQVKNAKKGFFIQNGRKVIK